MNMDDELASRWLGRTINNKYVVQSVVGNGGMAVVYSVKHRNGKRFALKMLHRELSLNQLIRQRFVREGYVANRVEHEGAVAVIDDDITEDGSAFLVMELLQGVTLERLWEANGNRLTLECVLAIAERLLDVLAAAHLQNIVHRDLKPANIFVTRHGVVKILDFGIARLREGDGNKTETGTTLGTPLFMPPEQASGRSRDVDARTDLWAVGATMFSLLSGQYVHDGENSAQVLIAVATTPAKSLAAVVPDAPAEVVHIVDKALAFHNEDRWESAIAMRGAILEAQTKLGLPVVNEFLARIVRATAPGTGSNDVQSTPATTPAPVDRTERIPATPPNPWHSEVPLVSFSPSGLPAPRPSATPDPRPSATPDPRPPQDGDTKVSAMVPENAPGTPGKRSELAESSARAMTSPTVTPPARSKSRVGALLLAVAALAVAAIFIVRLGGSEHVPAPSVAAPPANPVTPVVVPAPPTTAAAPPVVALAVPSASAAPAEVSGEPPTVSVASAHPVAPAAALIKGAGRRVAAPRGGKTPASSSAPAAAASPAAVEAPAAPSPSPSPAPAPSPATTPANGRKSPPTLDRASPF